MSADKFEKPDTVHIGGNLNLSGGSTFGDDHSTNKMVTENMTPDLSNPVTMVAAAAKQIPAVWWGIGVAAILALVAIMGWWNVPPLALVLGGIGLFIGMVGLYVFASLMNPPAADKKPPASSMALLWAFLALFIAVGLFAVSSFFFDWPLPLKSKLMPSETKPSISTPATTAES